MTEGKTITIIQKGKIVITKPQVYITADAFCHPSPTKNRVTVYVYLNNSDGSKYAAEKDLSLDINYCWDYPMVGNYRTVKALIPQGTTDTIVLGIEDVTSALRCENVSKIAWIMSIPPSDTVEYINKTTPPF